ncbi:MAG: LPS export ABC transporter periplasmic protein LptC [Gammaproteobacteria bacterium]|nr:LPS export ABC transporter periplasmic protein LptC [Gammaproteobacteria bacterium]
MQRFKLLVLPGMLAILIFLTVDYFNQAVESPGAPESVVEVAFNGYSEGINSVHFDEQGNIRYTMRADRQISYVDAETLLEEPYIQLYQENDSRWNIIARSGRISATQENLAEVEEIILSGDVEVYQLDQFGNRTVLATEILTLEPALDVLTTEAAVTMVSNTFEQSATGMRVDLNTEEYVFHQDVRGRYAAPQN